jgi:hypothetical protein
VPVGVGAGGQVFILFRIYYFTNYYFQSISFLFGQKKTLPVYCRKGYFFSISFFIGKKPNRLFPQLLLVPLR